MKRALPHWIRHSHFFDPDEYECSACGAVFRKETRRCPGCGAQMAYTHDRQDWIDELEELDMILEDDD